ncbi:conserved hypothetical protein [Desulfamplus magnetovallimortis]|uniref:Cytoplasmic protein n=1 Tax=Desulfamplus magnetovallimortis TaxID=1246637 RepID=A0A1W1HGQ4_9BACT|nr:DUF1456 family protein [Desulfamplus magnetovallimortis]SLM31562.1 conserved hypothetical protein [Desulfamplus magnetovallimortis]
MENNDILRRFRYALDIPDTTMVKIFSMAGCNMAEEQLRHLLKKEGDDGYVQCGDDLLELFLDALIVYNRGQKAEESAGSSFQSSKSGHNSGGGKTFQLTNNMILKKLRIALELQQDSMLDIFRLGGVNMSKGELTAIFRKDGHKNYKVCGDQYLKKFLNGLGVRHRM